MSKQFNHLNIPSHWQSYWTRFPEGHTILEALIQWVSQVDEMVDNQNKLSDTVSNYGTRLDQFIDQFDGHLSDEVKNTLGEWQQSGFLDVVINDALDTKYHEMDQRLTEQLVQTTGNIDIINEKINGIDRGYGGTYSTLYDLMLDIPNGDDKRYVISETGEWYFWDGSTWKSGGLFQAIGIEDESIQAIKTDFIIENFNNPNDTHELSFINAEGIIQEGALNVTGKIPTKSGDNWIIKRARVAQVIAQYNSNDELLSFVPGYGTTGSDEPFIYKPRNSQIAYFRVQYSRWVDTKDNFMVIKGTRYPQKTIPYGLTIENLNIEKEKMENKNVLIVGDSIAVADGTSPAYAGETIVGFQEVLRENGLSVTTTGYSGATYRKWSDVDGSGENYPSLYTSIITSNEVNFTNYDIIILMAGNNDVGRGLKIGELGSRDSETTVGALSLIIEKIRDENKEGEIILVTPTQNNSSTHTEENDRLVYKSLLDVSDAYGILSFDLFNNSGIGKGNIDYYTYADLLHWNNKGHKLVGNKILSIIKFSLGV